MEILSAHCFAGCYHGYNLTRVYMNEHLVEGQRGNVLGEPCELQCWKHGSRYVFLRLCK
jgi:hypothetical protein